MRLTIRPLPTLLTASLLVIAGCTTIGPKPAMPGDEAGATPSSLAEVEALLESGDYNGAMSACIDLARIDPLMDGLPELQSRVINAITEARLRASRLESENTNRRADADVEERFNLPDTYTRRLKVQGKNGSLRTPPSSMQEVLSKKVTVRLEKVDLEAFILAMGADESINIIADDSLQDLGTFTIHAEDTPLKEILDYVSRNLGVAFNVGESIIWVSQDDNLPTGTPLQTRMYHLRKGITSRERQAGEDTIRIVEAIDRLVPEVEGADHFFDSKSHVLLARNTRENLTLIEDIIAELDVSPPQILIESRFISTDINDLRELGIDWVLNSPLVTTRKAVINSDGNIGRLPKTQVNPGNVIGFAPLTSQAQGLNIAYQGILTEPAFQAVLHALRISGRSRALSSPKVTTVNNEAASIRIGEDFRYFEEYDVQSVESGTEIVNGVAVRSTENIVVPVGTPSVEELGISLEVTPSVGADMDSIALELIPEISEFVRYEVYEVAAGNRRANNVNNNNNVSTNNTTSTVRVPIFRRSRIETELVVRSGETVVMGGLISSQRSDTKSGVPILSSIPLIGRFFRSSNTEESRQNLLIFLTATILSERGEELVAEVD